MKTPLVAGIISAIVSAVLAGIFGILAGIVIEKRRSGDEDRRRHISDLRREVFEPLVQRIESYSLPICQGRKPAIEIESAHVAGPVGDPSKWEDEWTDTFVPLKTLGHPRTLTPLKTFEEVRDLSHGRLNKVLYSHTKDVHLSDLLLKYEEAEAELVQYQNDCVKAAEELLQPLSRALGVPIRRRSAHKESGSLFKSLGLFILERGLGISKGSVYIQRYSPPMPWYEAAIHEDDEYYAFGSVAQMEKAMDLIRTLAEDSARWAPLKEQARYAEARFTELVREFKAVLAQARLPGKCGYV